MKHQVITRQPAGTPAAHMRAALSWLSQIARPGAVVPVLCTVRLEPCDGGLTATANNLDMQADVTIPASDAGDFAPFCVSPRVLSPMLAHADAVAIKGHGAERRIEADGLTLRLAAPIPVQDFPEMPTPGGPVAVVPEGILQDALRATLPFVSMEETRYYLNGVHLIAHGGALRAEATNGHVMSRLDTGLPWPHTAAILPRAAARALMARLRRGGDDAVAVTAGDLRMAFAGNGWALTAKLIDGTFPDLDRVIPRPPDAGDTRHGVTLSAALLRRIPWAGLSPCAEFHPGAGLRHDMGDGQSAEVPLPVSGKAPFGANAHYLRQFASGAPDGLITLEGANLDQPFRVLTSDPRLTQVLMPMRV